MTPAVSWPEAWSRPGRSSDRLGILSQASGYYIADEIAESMMAVL